MTERQSIPDWAIYSPGARSRLDAARKAARKRKRDSGRTTKGRALTDEQEADIVRRIRRFENPHSIAKEFGITSKTVLQIVDRSKKFR